MTIHRAGEADIAVIRQLAHRIWPAVYNPIIGPAQVEYMLQLFYSERALRRELADQIFLLGYIAAVPMAYASFQPGAEAGMYRIPKLYVDGSLRGKGFGRKMLDTIAEEVLAADGRVMRLNVNRHNPALAFYEKYGFTIIHQEDNDIGAGYFMNDFVMEKRLD